MWERGEEWEKGRSGSLAFRLKSLCTEGIYKEEKKSRSSMLDIGEDYFIDFFEEHM